MVAAAVRGSGRPGTADTVDESGKTGSAFWKTPGASASPTASIGTGQPSARAVVSNRDVSPSTTNGGTADSFRCSQALSVISGPMPAGSPSVTARGRAAGLTG